MKRPGDILRERRKEFGLSLLELESNSHIPRRSLEALESDQYDFFSAESYYCGFLKNYAEMLKLDPKILLDAYRNVKIIESPLPMEQLMGSSRNFQFSPLLISMLVLLLIIVSGVSYFVFYKMGRTVKPRVSLEQESEAKPQVSAVVIDRYPWMQDLKDGLVLSFVLDVGRTDLLQPELRVRWVGKGFQLVSLDPSHEYKLTLAIGKTNILPLRFANTDDQSSSFHLNFTLQDDASVLVNLSENSLSTPQGAFSAKFEAFQQQNQKTVPHAILQASKPMLLQLQLTFQRDSYIRYQWFGQEVQEFSVLKDKILLLPGEAPLTLWLSDVNATKIKINGQDLIPEAFQNVFIGRLEWKREGRVARLYLTPIS